MAITSRAALHSDAVAQVTPGNACGGAGLSQMQVLKGLALVDIIQQLHE